MDYTQGYDQAKTKELRKAYDKAVKAKKPEFEFKGETYLTDFAKYLLQVLEPRYGIKSRG